METPPLTTMAATLAIETVKHVASGFKNRTQEEYDRIRSVCKSCDHVFYDGQMMRCGKCGCNMSIKIKWATTRCPIKKW